MKWKWRRKELKRWLRYWVLRVALQPLALLPLQSARRFGGACGAMAWSILPGLRRKALANLEAAFPEWQPARRVAVARGVLRWIGVVGADVLHIGGPDHQAILETIEVRGLENLPEERATNGGIVLVTGHLGNWELLASWFAAIDRPSSAFYHPFTERRLNRLVEKLRTRAGIRYLPAGKSALPAVRALRRGEVVGLLIDRVPRGQAVVCSFFGRECRTAPGAAWLALATRSRLVPIALFLRSDGGYLLDIRPPLDPTAAEWGSGDAALAALTRRLTAILEEQIREAPEQWPWFFDRWRIRSEETLGDQNSEVKDWEGEGDR